MTEHNRAHPCCPADAAETVAAVKDLGGGVSLMRCDACGLTFAHPPAPMRQDEYEAAYDEGSYYVRWEFTEALRGLPGGRSTLLDVGCGAGAFLRKAAARGCEVWGIDFNRDAVRKAREAGLDRVFSVTIGEFRRTHPGRRFDVITCFHVLEHVSEPLEFLRDMNALLEPGGEICLAVPNPDRFLHRFSRRRTADCFPHHVTFWTKAAMSGILERAGFAVSAASDRPPVTLSGVFLYAYDILYHGLRIFQRSPATARAFAIVLAGLAVPATLILFRTFILKGASIYVEAYKPDTPAGGN